MQHDHVSLHTATAFAADAQRLVGARIRERRIELGWSQEMLAYRAHLHRTYISSVECGARNMTLLNLLRLAFELGVDPANLVQGIQLSQSVLGRK